MPRSGGANMQVLHSSFPSIIRAVLRERRLPQRVHLRATGIGERFVDHTFDGCFHVFACP
jgi:hypothetical protein